MDFLSEVRGVTHTFLTRSKVFCLIVDPSSDDIEADNKNECSEDVGNKTTQNLKVN